MKKGSQARNMSQLPPLPSSLGIRRFDEIPSPEEFASEIESRNIPAVISALDKSPHTNLVFLDLRPSFL